MKCEPEALSQEQAEVEDELRLEFLKLQRSPEWLYLLGLHAVEQNSDGVLFLSAEVERGIIQRFPQLAGGLLTAVTQMHMLVHSQEEGKHYLSAREVNDNV